MLIKIIKQFVVLIQYGLSIKASIKYKIGYFIALLRKIYFILIGNPNYCYSYFPFKGEYVIENIYGKFLVSEPGDMSPIISSYFESDLIDHFKNTEKGVFLDIGSNIGKYSIILGKLGFLCYSIEPNPTLHKFIFANLELNGLKESVKLIPFGIDIHENHLKLKIPGGDNYGSGSIINDYVDYKEVNINLINFETLINKNNIDINDIRLIKIDVEGYEKNVIDSMVNYLGRFKNIKIIIEMFDNKGNVVDIKEILKNNGYELIHKLYGDNYIFYKN